LRNLRNGWSLDERKRYFAWFLKSPKLDQTGHPYPARNTQHTTQTIQWFKDVSRDYSDGASYNNFLKNLRKAALDNVGDADQRTALVAFLDDQPAAPLVQQKERKMVR
jgi:hypothetical protein